MVVFTEKKKNTEAVSFLTTSHNLSISHTNTENAVLKYVSSVETCNITFNNIRQTIPNLCYHCMSTKSPQK